MKIFAVFRRKNDPSPDQLESELVENDSTSTLNKNRTSITKTCVAVITGCTLLALITLSTDVWNPWNLDQVFIETPELYLCAPTPYQSDNVAVHDNDKSSEELPDDDIFSRFRRAGTTSQIRRVIRPLSLPPPIGFNFTIDPPLYHDSAARCSWSEFRKKKIPNLESDSNSFDYQLLDLSNCTDANDCRRFCFKLYKPNDPNLCNYIILDKVDQKASFYAIDPLLPWNLTEDTKVDSYSWNCEATPRCDWYWIRRQKLKSIDLADKPENLIGQVRCRDFGACQRLCESHPTCNYVVMPANNTRSGPSFLYTVPNAELQIESYAISETVDSFEIVCHEGNTPPPVLSPREPLRVLPTNGNETEAISVETNPENSTVSISKYSPSPSPEIALLAGNESADASADLANVTQLPLISVPQSLSTVLITEEQQTQQTVSAQKSGARKPKHGRRNNGAAAKEKGKIFAPPQNHIHQTQLFSSFMELGSSIAIKKFKRSASKGEITEFNRQLPLVRRCTTVGSQTDCQEMTGLIFDKNNAQCLRITLDEEKTKGDLQVQLYVRQLKEDWTSKGLWLSVRHPSNPLIQEDLFLKPSVKNELEIITKADGKKITCKENVTECKQKCPNKIAELFCGCKKFSIDSEESVDLCQTKSFKKCSESVEVKEEVEKCSEKCSSECQSYKYAVSLKSSMDDVFNEDSNALLIDVTVAYHGGLYGSKELICLFVVLILLALVYIASFIYCCYFEKRSV